MNFFSQFGLMKYLLILALYLISASISLADKNNLVIGVPYTPFSLDPHIGTGLEEYNIMRALFEGLCSDGPEEEGEAYPGMAESWTHSSDYKTWTFKLRKSNTWSDGKPLTAHDFVYSYQRILNPETNSRYCSMLFDIKNATEYNAGKIQDFSEVGVIVLDDFTLQIELHRSLPYLPELVKHFTWYPVPKHIIEKHNNNVSEWIKPNKIVSNGPFTLMSNIKGKNITVIKNPAYWDQKTVKLNSINFLIVPNPKETLNLIQNGIVHIMDINHRLFPKPLKELFPETSYQYPSYQSTFLRCNTTGDLKNKLVRKAIGLAIQREKLKASINDSSVIISATMTPPGAGYTPPIVTNGNIMEAKKLMKEAGFPDGVGFPEITLLTADNNVNVKLATELANQLKDSLGIIIKPEIEEWFNYAGKKAQLDYDLALGGWFGDYLDPTSFLDVWREDDMNNCTGWANEDYENLILKANLAPTSIKRMQILADAEKQMLEDYPIIPLFWHHPNSFVQTNVKGWKPRLNANFPYKYLSLAQTEK
jgi:oligopeptide transport system substrate-binding protein